MTSLVVPDLVRRAGAWHRPLMALTALMVVTTVVSAAGLVLDDRTLTGEAIWLKPLKFSVSIALYTFTWAWLLSLQQRPRRWVWWSGTLATALLGVEMIIIVGQVVRGRASHFNNATPFDNTLFTVMGAAITVVWLLGMVQGVVLLRERIPDRPMATAIRLGIALGSVGIGLAFLMTGPTPEQLDALRHDLSPDRIGAHSVGVPDGGPGMPITGWSTTGGDLRIPHFVGIHALQALPLLALLLGRTRRFADPGVRTRLVLVAGAAYTGLTALVTWQALRGQSLVQPDVWTLAALAALGAATALGARAAVS